MISRNVYVSSATKGWDEVDQMVLRAATRLPGASFGDIVRILPAGLHLALIHEALTWLHRHGDLSTTTAVVDGVITSVYTPPSKMAA